ncbi:MAG: VanZ family protein [Acidobacteriota bacterium]|nr:VanZ family protein [Acidobacteriota bacterium]
MRGTWRYSRELFWHYWLPVLILLAAIAMESTEKMSGHNTLHVMQRLLAALGVHLAEAHMEMLNLAMRKCGHATGYGLLGLSWMILLRGHYWLRHDAKPRRGEYLPILRLWWRKEWALLAVLFTFTVAAADELHQMVLPDRSGSWWDVTLDTSASLLVMVVLYLLARWRCRMRNA